MPLSSLANRVVLITGASSGFGEACAHEFANVGSKLVLVARRSEKLAAVKEAVKAKNPSAVVHCVTCDVSDHEAVMRMPGELPDEVKEVDVLVNNAGLALGTNLTEDNEVEHIDKVLDTNVKGVLYFLKAFVPGMKQRNRGHLIQIGSTAGLEAYNRGSLYCASKHALSGINRSLRIELLETDVRVSIINPGLAKTEFSVVRFDGDNDKADSVYKGLDPLTAIDIAETVVFVASRPNHVQITDVTMMPTHQATADKVHKVL